MNLNLQTLNMLIGSTVQLSLESENNETYHAKFIGYANKESLMLSMPTDGNTPLVTNIGDEFIVRFSDNEKQLAFRSQVIEVCERPFAYIHLSFPNGVQGTMLRRGQRYTLSKKPALKLAMTDGKNHTNVQMTDISQSGACLTALDQLGKIDDCFSIDIVVDNKQITLPCRIRYVRKENMENDSREFLHGVEFQNLNLDAQLFIDRFIQKHVQQQRTAH